MILGTSLDTAFLYRYQWIRSGRESETSNVTRIAEMAGENAQVSHSSRALEFAMAWRCVRR